MEFSGKKILVVGAGISGFAIAKIARERGAAVTLSDAKKREEITDDLAPYEQAGIALAFGPQETSLLDGVDTVVVSPAVPVRIPLIRAAIEREIPVTTEVQIAYELARAPIAAITGTNGKTTTTTLTGLLLAAHYGEGAVGVGGNIGVPLSEVALKTPDTGYIAAEISSYQMEATSHFHPRIAAVLSVTPDHIIRHGSMEVYQAMKERIFAEQDAHDTLVLNDDDERTRSMASRAKAHVLLFSRRHEVAAGAYLRAGHITVRTAGREEDILAADELGIKGPHNLENVMAAILIARAAGVTPAEMVPVLRDFRGVEHRIEYVTTIGGVDYYNDSKATNTDSAEKALLTFDDGIVLIAGGDDKMTDLTSFMALVGERVRHLVLLGDAAKRFHEDAVKNGYPEARIHEVGYSMEKAVLRASSLAKPGETVLLSPACASFDMYGGMAERGRHFKTLVRELEKQEERK